MLATETRMPGRGNKGMKRKPIVNRREEKKVLLNWREQKVFLNRDRGVSSNAVPSIRMPGSPSSSQVSPKYVKPKGKQHKPVIYSPVMPLRKK